MKVLGHSLSILTQFRAVDWDRHCQTVAMAYRTTPHPSTGNTPAYLVLGVDPRLPVDCEVDEGGADDADTEGRLEELTKWRNAVEERLTVEHEPTPTTQRIQPGMLVAYKLPPLEAKGGAAHKLQARFSEPWRVTKQLGNSVTYEIKHPLTRGGKVGEP